MRALNAEKDELWQKLEPTLRRQLATAPTDDALEHSIKEAEDNLANVKTLENALRDKLNKVQIDSKNSQNQALKVEFEQRDLQRQEHIFDTVNSALQQLELDAKNPPARVNLEFPAKQTNKPNADRRTQLMAAAPLAFGLLLLSLLVLFELHGRVSDHRRVDEPDEAPGDRRGAALAPNPPARPCMATATATAAASPRWPATSAPNVSWTSSCRALTTCGSPSAPALIRGDAIGIAC